MKLSWLLIILCLKSTPAFSRSYPFTYNDQREFKINAYEFRRYLRPQLRNMTKEFYDLFSGLHPSYGRLFKLKNLFIDWRLFYESFLGQCHTFQGDACASKLEGISILLAQMEEQLHYLMIETPPVFFEQDLEMFHQKGFRLLGQVQREIDRFAWQLLLLEVKPLQLHSISFRQRMYQMELHFQHLFLSLVPTPLSALFFDLYFDFIRPIEQEVLAKEAVAVLEKNLEDLNMNWNYFHMSLSKGSVEVSSSIKSQIKIMHNRWNSILKVVLN